MGLFVKRKPQLNRQQLEQVKKHLGIDLSQYAKKDELEQYFNDKVTSEERKRLWDSLSPRLKIKLLQYLKDKKEKNNARKK